MFIILLSSIVNASRHTKCVLLNNQKYMIQPTLINLHPNENSQEFHYYPFSVTIHFLFQYNCRNKWIRKTLTKDISCECKHKFNGRKCNSNQWWNKDECRYKYKKHHISENDYVCNPVKRNCENEKYLVSIMDDSVIKWWSYSYDEKIRTIPTNFNEKE